jgi:formylglycine-generating enzyme required for sulfatase activity
LWRVSAIDDEGHMREIGTAICFGFLLLMLGADVPATAPKDSLTIDLGGGVSMEMILIHPGSFLMGSEKGEDDEKPVHKVTISRPFYLGKFEVTQEQWQAVMGANPASFKGPKNPVENVSWDDCQIFLRELAKKIPGKTFKLPTEAQWEYACRAGGGTTYAFGDDPKMLGEYTWFLGNSGNTAHPVGQKKLNAWGLYDMQGNVCEWCADFYNSAYPPGDATDPTGPAGGDGLHVLRGESWVSNADTLRPSYRVGTPADYRNTHVGLRLAYSPE